MFSHENLIRMLSDIEARCNILPAARGRYLAAVTIKLLRYHSFIVIFQIAVPIITMNIISV